jgi:hypothetical protein
LEAEGDITAAKMDDIALIQDVFALFDPLAIDLSAVSASEVAYPVGLGCGQYLGVISGYGDLVKNDVVVRLPSQSRPAQ